MLICRHITFCSAIYQIHMLHAFTSLRCSCSIHRSISATDDNHIFAKIHFSTCLVEVFQKLQCVYGLFTFQFQLSAFVSTNSKNDIVIFLAQFCYRRSFCTAENLHAEFFKQGSIFSDYVVINTEIWNHCTDNTAKFFSLLINCNLGTQSCQIERYCHTGWTTAHYSNCLIAATLYFQSLYCFFVCIFCTGQFCIANLNGCLIEITCTMSLTWMCTDTSCDKRKRISV